MDEESAIVKLKNMVKENKVVLPFWWKDGDYLRVIHFSNFDLNEAYEKIRTVYSYFQRVSFIKPIGEVERLLVPIST